MKLFQLQTDLMRYTYPTIKIIICVAIIIFNFSGKRLFHFSHPIANVSMRMIALVILVASFLCLYISIGEVFHTYSNRKNNSHHSRETMLLPIETIRGLAERNPQIEIEVKMDNKILKLGSSSDLKRPKYHLEDKLYYIDKVEYESLEPFSEALQAVFPEEFVPVLRIDGLAVSKIKNFDEY